VCAHVGNQQSCGVVIGRLRSSVQNLLHQCRSEDWEPTPHQVVLNFRLPLRYYHVPLVRLPSFIPRSTEKQKKLHFSLFDNLLSLHKFNFQISFVEFVS
jgi:hypothetical protein